MSTIRLGLDIAFVSGGGIPLGASLQPLQLQPHLALGSLGLTVLIATVVALTAVSAFVLQGRAAGNRRRIAIVGGLIYAVALLSFWAGVRILFWRFAAEFPSDLPFVLLIMIGVGMLFITQWGGATILYFTYRFVSLGSGYLQRRGIRSMRFSSLAAKVLLHSFSSSGSSTLGQRH